MWTFASTVRVQHWQLSHCGWKRSRRRCAPTRRYPTCWSAPSLPPCNTRHTAAVLLVEALSRKIPLNSPTRYRAGTHHLPFHSLPSPLTQLPLGHSRSPLADHRDRVGGAPARAGDQARRGGAAAHPPVALLVGRNATGRARCAASRRARVAAACRQGGGQGRRCHATGCCSQRRACSGRTDSPRPPHYTAPLRRWTAQRRRQRRRGWQ